MRVLALFPVLLVGLVGQDLDAFSASRFVLAGFGHGVQLSDLVLTADRSRIGTLPPPAPPDKARPELPSRGKPGFAPPRALTSSPGGGAALGGIWRGRTTLLTSCTEQGKTTRLQRGRERAGQPRPQMTPRLALRSARRDTPLTARGGSAPPADEPSPPPGARRAPLTIP